MSRHVLTTVAVAVFSLSVLGPPVQAQDNPSAQELADLRARAEAGATEAHFLGLMYDYGEGVPQDDAEAVRWYRLAAEQGHAGAQNKLGFAYGTGDGVPQDDAEAARWYRLAAEQGNASAQYNLGVAYGTGDGVPQGASEITRRTPRRPRLTRLRRNAVQKAPSSEAPASTPSTCRSPSVVTPTATAKAWASTWTPSRSTSPWSSSNNLPTNAGRSILGLAIRHLPSVCVLLPRRTHGKRCAMAASLSSGVGLLNFHHVRGL